MIAFLFKRCCITHGIKFYCISRRLYFFIVLGTHTFMICHMYFYLFCKYIRTYIYHMHINIHICTCGRCPLATASISWGPSPNVTQAAWHVHFLEHNALQRQKRLPGRPNLDRLDPKDDRSLSIPSKNLSGTLPYESCDHRAIRYSGCFFRGPFSGSL